MKFPYIQKIKARKRYSNVVHEPFCEFTVKQSLLNTSAAFWLEESFFSIVSIKASASVVQLRAYHNKLFKFPAVIAVVYHQLGHSAVDADVLACYYSCFVFERVLHTFSFLYTAIT